MGNFLRHFWEKERLHDVIECLTTAMDEKDKYTSGHSNRVADMAYDIAKELGLKGHKLETIHLAAHLHDIGKLGISEKILNKPEKLLPEEWEEIKRHPEIGFNILHKSHHMKEISHIVLHHHERWDGKGYPGGLKESQIPLGARIISVADSIDAMTYERPYRSAMSWGDCRREIIKNSGIQFDPEVVKAMWSVYTKWEYTNQKSPAANTGKILSNL